MSQFRFISAGALGVVIASSMAQAQHEDHRHGESPPNHVEGQGESSAQGSATLEQHPRSIEPYTLKTCPVSGEPLGEMGDPIVKVYDGREVRLCCAGCVEKFEGDADEYWKKIDAQIVKEQLPYYPVATCLVTGEPLAVEGEDTAINLVYRNRLIRLCCTGCIVKFKKDPETVLKELDAAVIHQQRNSYPLQTCVVSGEALDSMGEPLDVVVGGRLVRLCCAGCVRKLRSDPLPYLSSLDKAWKQQGLPRAVARGSESEHAGHDEHSEQGSHIEKQDEDGHDGHNHDGGG